MTVLITAGTEFPHRPSNNSLRAELAPANTGHSTKPSNSRQQASMDGSREYSLSIGEK